MKKVLITGGTGLVGLCLCTKLMAKGYSVSILSRNKSYKTDAHVVYWDVDNGVIDKVAINSSDYIVHLAGSNIFDGRWTNSRKQELYDSRIGSARLIYKNIDRDNNRLKAFISASAVGCYGTSLSERVFTEDDFCVNDFLAGLCDDWEIIAHKFRFVGARTVAIRTGIVLANNAGFLPKFAGLISSGLGAPLGSGRQYMPWIHIEDLCNIYIKAIEDRNMKGTYNAVAPEFINNRNFTKTVARVMNRRIWFPAIPSLFLRMALGARSSMIIGGKKISPDKIINAGYDFEYKTLESALDSLNVKKTHSVKK